MRALVYHGPGQKAWEESPKPQVTEDTDAVVRVDADRGIDKGFQLSDQGRRLECPLHTLLHNHFVGALDDFLVEHVLALEIVVDRGAGQVRANRDFLERRGVVAEFAEHLPRRSQDAFAGLRCLRCGRPSRAPGCLWHARIVSHLVCIYRRLTT